MSTIPSSPANPCHQGTEYCEEGLTKREYFAAVALTGFLSRATERPPVTQADMDTAASRAVRAADALIAKLNEENPT